MPAAASDSKLPRFRRDLKVFNGPLEPDGSPTYNIYDPTKGKYYKIAWKESLVFKCYTGESTAEELAAKISSLFPVKITVEDVNNFFSQAYLIGLLQIPKDGESLYQTFTKSREGWYSWLLTHYLFLKIPFFRPDAFLTRTLPYVRIFGSWPALLIYATVILIGFATLIGRFDQFIHTFSYFFTMEGAFIYACMVSCVKIVHELSHAYVAKYYGLYVPTMGIGLLVLWPVLYTDVTEGWKLSNRKERFLISFAGVASELVMAGFATIGWILSSPGIFQSLCFVLASTSWFSTIIININPAVRFDGYYILCDLWGVDNLMPRAFAVARWKFHEWFFGIDAPCPEDNLSPQRTAGFVAYTAYTLIYRFFLYTAIALFVYYQFTKALGIFLFLAEVWIFFIMPVVWEMSVLYHLRSKLTVNKRSICTLILLFLLLFWVIVPLPHKMTFPAVIISKERQLLYAPEEGKIKSISAEKGREVNAGTSLIKIESEPLSFEIAKAKYALQIMKNELYTYLQNPSTENRIAEKEAEITKNEQTILGLLKRKANLDIVAQINGQLADWKDTLQPGQYVTKSQVFGLIINRNQMDAVVYISEDQSDDFKVGQPATIILQDSSVHFIEGKIASIDRKRISQLIYPSLASVYGGPLAVTPLKTQPGSLLLHDSYYEVVITLESPLPDLFFGQSAEIKIRGPWKSYLVEILKYVYRAVYKESSF